MEMSPINQYRVASQVIPGESIPFEYGNPALRPSLLNSRSRLALELLTLEEICGEWHDCYGILERVGQVPDHDGE
jgi:hypothetical protein